VSKQHRSTSWERKCDGYRYERTQGAEARRLAREKLGPVTVMDIESISRAIKRTSLTRIGDDGVMRGEAVDAMAEDRMWSEV